MRNRKTKRGRTLGQAPSLHRSLSPVCGSQPPIAQVLATSTYKQWKKKRVRLAVLPWGATEAHNFHLPYATDTLMAEKVAAKAAQLAAKRGAKIAVLPAIPYGSQANTMAFNMNMNLNPSTQFLILKDIIASLKAHKVEKLVILNGHGGNDFNAMQRELYGCGIFLVIVNLWQLDLKYYQHLFKEKGGHADEYETSVALHLFPELVLPLSEADSGRVKEPKIKALREGWAKISRPWEALTRESGVGNPFKATAAKGRQANEGTVERLAGFFAELSKAKLGKNFPY